MFDSTGESTWLHGTWSVEPDVLDRLRSRARLSEDPLTTPFAFIDRSGKIHLSFETAVKFCQAFAAAEPQTVLGMIQDAEREWTAKSLAPGDDFHGQYLREQGPAFAVIRQWCGGAEVADLHRQLDELRHLVDRAVWALRRVVAEKDAERIERGLRG